ncbi:MAG: hypothetical protein JWO03_2247 [Bacteroidetes bacterium]|nr:hypothetical protein [Bacteroidota bacterium]
MERYDLAWMDDDLDISGGDIYIALSDKQHIEDTIIAFPGWWKQFHQDGVGIWAYYGGPNRSQQLQQNVSLALQADGYTVTNPSVTYLNGKVIVNPYATI